MRILLTALIITSALCGVLFTQSEKIRLSVSPFDDSVTAAGEEEKAGAGISARLESSFREVDRFYVRPANAIREYITALELAQLGLADPDQLTGVSGTLQVNYLTVGTIAKFGSRYEVDARTVNIDDWSIVHSYGSSARSVDAAVKDIEWYISEQFTSEYLARRRADSRHLSTVSVFRFRDENRLAVDAGYSGAFSEILNSQMGSYTGIITIERKYAGALIEEKTLEMLGVVENDDSDISFDIRGIQYKMEGGFRVFDDLICINYRLYDTSDGRIVFMGSRDITSAAALRPAARVIANIVEDVIQERVGTVKITSVPSNARVYIDNKMIGHTPFTASFEKGSRSLRVVKENYETHEQSIDVAPRRVNEFNVELKRKSKGYIIGDRGPGGGFVFYDKGDSSGGWRYLEAAPEDHGSAEWGCWGTDIPGARETGIGSGRSNTRAIIDACGDEGVAAEIASLYQGGGKSDWFLPSKDELALIYENLNKAGVGGFSNDFYWSSSEDNAGSSWNQDFSNGYQSTIYKSYNVTRVLAVRAFSEE